jgi:hypothetical protein
LFLILLRAYVSLLQCDFGKRLNYLTKDEKPENPVRSRVCSQNEILVLTTKRSIRTDDI